MLGTLFLVLSFLCSFLVDACPVTKHLEMEDAWRMIQEQGVLPRPTVEYSFSTIRIAGVGVEVLMLSGKYN